MRSCNGNSKCVNLKKHTGEKMTLKTYCISTVGKQAGIAVSNNQKDMKCMLVLSWYKYSLLQGSQASQHQLKILATCHGLKYFCEKERRSLFATAFAGRAKTQSLRGTEEHPGSPAALKDFIPSRCPCLPSVLLLGCSQSGIHFSWQKWQSASPWELCCILRMLGEGRCWRVCIRNTKLIPRAAHYTALSSCRATDTQRQPWNHLLWDPRLCSPGTTGRLSGVPKMQQQRAFGRQSCQAYSPGLK